MANLIAAKSAAAGLAASNFARQTAAINKAPRGVTIIVTASWHIAGARPYLSAYALKQHSHRINYQEKGSPYPTPKKT